MLAETPPKFLQRGHFMSPTGGISATIANFGWQHLARLSLDWARFGGLANYQMGFTRKFMRAVVINCFRLRAMARTETARSRSHTANPECHG